MPLIIQKQSYSSLPWRLVRVHGGVARTLSDSGFHAKRDAAVVHAALLAIGNWDTYADWTPDQYAAVQRILDAAPMRTQQRALTAWGGGW